MALSFYTKRSYGTLIIFRFHLSTHEMSLRDKIAHFRVLFAIGHLFAVFLLHQKLQIKSNHSPVFRWNTSWVKHKPSVVAAFRRNAWCFHIDTTYLHETFRWNVNNISVASFYLPDVPTGQTRVFDKCPVELPDDEV